MQFDLDLRVSKHISCVAAHKDSGNKIYLRNSYAQSIRKRFTSYQAETD